MKVHSRAQWNARKPRSVHNIPCPTPRLWLHHTAGPASTGPAVIAATQKFHMDPKPHGRGWNDIAYSFLVEVDGTAWEGRGAGVAGGHTAGDNTRSHAICAVGNFDTRPVPPEMVEGIAQLVAHGHIFGWWPNRITGGHRQAPGASTACPGKHLYARIPDINRRAAEILAGIKPTPPSEEDDMYTDADRKRDNETRVLVQALYNEAVATMDDKGRSRLDRFAQILADLDRDRRKG